jgi:hypothetical protein
VILFIAKRTSGTGPNSAPATGGCKKTGAKRKHRRNPRIEPGEQALVRRPEEVVPLRFAHIAKAAAGQNPFSHVEKDLQSQL